MKVYIKQLTKEAPISRRTIGIGMSARCDDSTDWAILAILVSTSITSSKLSEYWVGEILDVKVELSLCMSKKLITYNSSKGFDPLKQMKSWLFD